MPEDFLVRFNDRADLEDVVHAPVPLGTPFYLIWKQWRCQSMASARAMCYKVLLGLKGMPAHTWSSDIAERILGSSYALVTKAP